MAYKSRRWTVPVIFIDFVLLKTRHTILELLAADLPKRPQLFGLFSNVIVSLGTKKKKVGLKD